ARSQPARALEVELADHPLHLRGVVIEPQPAARHVGDIRQDVGRGRHELPILQVLGVDKLDLVNRLHLLQQHGADQAVEIGTCYQSHGYLLSNHLLFSSSSPSRTANTAASVRPGRFCRRKTLRMWDLTVLTLM